MVRRERLEHHGAHYDIPVSGRHRSRQAAEADGAARCGRRSRSTSLRSRRRRCSQAFEIADGWLPIFWSPEQARSVFPLDRARDGFDIAPSVPAIVTDDVESGRATLKEYYSFYIGGMGAR